MVGQNGSDTPMGELVKNIDKYAFRMKFEWINALSELKKQWTKIMIQVKSGN